MGHRTRRVLRRVLQRAPFGLWYDTAYRLPIPGLEGTYGLEPRRADYVLWTLQDLRAVRPSEVHTPAPVSFADILRVHEPAYVERTTTPAELARIFGVGEGVLEVDEVLHTVRLGCGGTIEAARFALAHEARALNLLGGFHHAAPGKGGGLCVYNDIAIALAVLRAEGFGGAVAVIDLDAHPGDGTAACLGGDPTVWRLSLTGQAWPGAPGEEDEVVVPAGGGAHAYQEALERGLSRRPEVALAFVIAGADVLQGDPLGKLALSPEDCVRRDSFVLESLEGVPQVWLPGGGYSTHAWRVLAATGVLLATGKAWLPPEGTRPLQRRFRHLAKGLAQDELTQGFDIDALDIAADLGIALHTGEPLFLGFYTKSGIELALQRYGALEPLHRMGFHDIRVELDRVDVGDRSRLYGRRGGREVLLVEMVLERQTTPEGSYLYVHWLTIQNPTVSFPEGRRPLPGQEHPGLGIFDEVCELIARMAERLHLDDVAQRPAYVHMAILARRDFEFHDLQEEARLVAIERDLGHLGLRALSEAVAQGRVLCDGQPYRWDPGLMVTRRVVSRHDPTALQAAAEAIRFTLATGGAAGQ